MAWIWTKRWGSADDGNVFGGANLETLQTDITANAVDLTSDQSIAGAKTFTGSIVFTGTVSAISRDAEYVFWEDEPISYEDEIVTYT